MMQEILEIEKSIKQRRESDIKLTNFWVTILLLSPVTLGIYPVIQGYKQIARIDKFIQRKRKYYEGTVNYTEKYLKENNCYDEYQYKCNELRDSYKENFLKECKELNYFLSFLFIIITFGIYGIYFGYKVNKIWDDIQKFEDDFYEKLNGIWNKVGIIKYPINFKYDSSKNRNYIVNLILSIVSFGIWGLVWNYKLWVDPDNLYGEIHTAEDVVLATVRK